MHRSIKELQKYHIRASDGEIGRCKDFVFDDQAWVIRYLVADTRKWLPGRKVLVPPQSLNTPHVENRLLPVEHTKEEIRESPPLDADEPVSRKYEKKVIVSEIKYSAYPEPSSVGPPKSDGYHLSSRPKLAGNAA